MPEKRKRAPYGALSCLADQIFIEFHSSDIGAHCGIEKTHNAIISRYYWPGMQGDVQKFITNTVLSVFHYVTKCTILQVVTSDV